MHNRLDAAGRCRSASCLSLLLLWLLLLWHWLLYLLRLLRPISRLQLLPRHKQLVGRQAELLVEDLLHLLQMGGAQVLGGSQRKPCQWQGYRRYSLGCIAGVPQATERLLNKWFGLFCCYHISSVAPANRSAVPADYLNPKP